MPVRHEGAGLLPMAILAIVAAALMLMLVRVGLYMRRRARLLALTVRVTESHARLLSVKQRQLVKHDGYGNYDLSAWIAHANYFIDGVILRDARQQGIDVAGTAAGERLRADITRRFLGVVNATEPTAIGPVATAIGSGHAYETMCHALLEAAGWIVSTTPVTGDQGADLIADAGGRRVVIQCKFHAKPIGNKAVQEAYGARNMHGADEAVVVSNNSFTRSAIELARANDVFLLHHDQLTDLASLIAAGRTKPPGCAFDAGRSA